WLTSTAGDPFCTVFPQNASAAGDLASSSTTTPTPDETHTDDHRPQAIPKSGRTVRFTGTFLKMVRYMGGDGPRLAPLIVGNQAPTVIASEANTDSARVRMWEATQDHGLDFTMKPVYWAVCLAVAALFALALARWHLRLPVPRRIAMTNHSANPDPPL